MIKRTSKKKIFYLIGILFFTAYASILLSSTFDLVLEDDSSKFDPIDEVKDSIPHPIISLNGNGALVNFTNNTGGNGTSWGDAVVIENLEITVSGATPGIRIDNTDVFLIIRNCTITNSSGMWNAGIVLNNCSNVNVSGNGIFNCWSGIFINIADSLIIEHNNASNNVEPGIVLNECNNSIVFNNTVFNNTRHGIVLGGVNLSCSFNFVSNNTEHGIYPSMTDGSNITDNIIFGNGNEGIEVFGDNHTIARNVIFSNGYNGIRLSSTNYCNLTNNTIYNNNLSGIELVDSMNTTILGNDVKYNDDDGVHVQGTSADNTIILNTIHGNNDLQAFSDIAGNSWDNGSLGNYWGDYETLHPSASNDGFVWNETYDINGSLGEVDNYPLVYPASHYTGPYKLLQPIFINGTAELDAYPNKTGNGTIVSPYVIEGMLIDARELSSCITILNTDKPLEIRDCLVLNSGDTFNDTWAGIRLDNVTDVLIDSVEINNSLSMGIVLSNSNQVTINNTGINNSNANGILLDNNDGIIVGNASIQNVSMGAGIYLVNSDNTLVGNSSISSTPYAGIAYNLGENLTLDSNNFTNCFFSLYIEDAGSLNMTGNDLGDSGIGFFSFKLHEMTSNTIDTTNLVNGKPVYYITNATGLSEADLMDPGQVFLVNCTDSSFSDVMVSQAMMAFVLVGCNNTMVNNFTLSDNFGGLFLASSNYTMITDCNFHDNMQMAINLYEDCENNTISGNVINNTLNLGLLLAGGSKNNSIIDNHVVGNAEGVQLSFSSNNTIKGNTWENNTMYAIEVYDGFCDNNTISGNYFISNNGGGVQAYDDGTSTNWDNGSYGNIWDDYFTRYPDWELNGSILNNSYTMDGGAGGMDRYPIYDFSILGHISHAPIFIDGNAELDAFPHKSGNGTISSPYVIEYLLVDAQNNDTCITIFNTDKPLEIKNCILLNAGDSGNDTWGGVILENITNCLVDGVQVNDSEKIGVSVAGSMNITIKNSNFSNNSAYCLGVGFSNNVNVSGITCQGPSYSCISVGESNNTLVENCSVQGGYMAGIVGFLGYNLTFNDNNVSNSDFFDIVLSGVTNANMSGNRMVGHGFLIQSLAELNYSETWIIDSTNLVNERPIYYYVNQTNLSPANFTNAGQVYLVNCNDSMITGLNISNVSLGMMMGNSHNNTLSSSLFEGCSYYPFFIVNSSDNQVEGNWWENNTFPAIFVFDASCNNNTIYNNYFINNTGGGIQAYDNGTGTNWDNGSYGNVWSDYLTRYPNSELNGSILNNSYAIDGGAGGLDRFPVYNYSIHGYINHAPIIINGNAELAAFCAGSGRNGTLTNPYIIEYYTIDAAGVGSCIDIDNTDQYLIIRNCSVTNAEVDFFGDYAGIHLQNCSNIIITNSTVSFNEWGIVLRNCTNILVDDNDFIGQGYVGIEIDANSEYNTVSNNNFTINPRMVYNTNANNTSIISNFGYLPGEIQVHDSWSCNVSLNNISEMPDTGIVLNNVTNSVVQGNVLSGMSNSGVYIMFSTNITVSANDAKQNGYYGICLEYTNDSVIVANNASLNNDTGIWIENCQDDNITGNHIHQNINSGITVSHSQAINVSWNQGASNGGAGIDLEWDSQHNVISFNNLSNHMSGEIVISSGCDSNILDGNIVENDFLFGIALVYNRNNTLINNVFNNCSVYIVGSGEDYTNHSIDTSNTVNGKTLYFFANQTGIFPGDYDDAGSVYLVLCNDSVIKNLDFMECTFPVNLFGCFNVTVENVSASGGGVGIYIEEGGNNTITRCNITDNRYGVAIEFSENNTVYMNSFINNTIFQGFVSSGIYPNDWDNGTHGNYWSDYQLVNPGASNDGNFWNESYYINMSAPAEYDNHPLVNPYIPVPVANFTCNATNVVEGDWIQFNFTGYEGDSPANFSWDFGDGTANSTDRDPLHQYESPGVYNVTLTVVDFDGDGNTLTKVDHISVFPDLSKPIEIVGDAELDQFCAAYGTNGTISNPHVIENFTIDATNLTAGIMINMTTRILVIQNCTITASPGMGGVGILLASSSNILIANSSIDNVYIGVQAMSGANLTIFNNTVANSEGAIMSGMIQNVSISSNTLSSNLIGIEFQTVSMGDTKIITNNIMTNCGIYIAGMDFALSEMQIDTSNLVNGKPVYFYSLVPDLESANFTNPGQIILVGCMSPNVSDISISDVHHGISIYSSMDVILERNALTNCLFQGIGLTSTYNATLKNNTFVNSGVNVIGEGDFLSHDIDTSNVVNGKPIYYLVNQSNLVPANFTGAGQVILGNCSNSTVGGLTISDTTIAIQLAYTVNCTISNNMLNNNHYMGLMVFYCNETNLFNNTIIDSRVGFYMMYCHLGEIRLNNISFSKQVGLTLGMVTNFTFRENEISNSRSIGMYLLMCENNTLYLNNFMNNSVNAYVYDFSATGINTWDNGTHGNYWSDYAMLHPNATNDGVSWNESYLFPLATPVESDNHPLVNPVVLNIPPANSPPELSGGNVLPVSGNQTTIFNFTVLYVDADNDPPSHVTVTINGSDYSMGKVNTSDNDFTDGCLYQYTTLLAPDTYEYQFSCNDGTYTTSTTLYTGLVVSFVNTAPELTTGSVLPGSGNQTTIFNFTVVYTDVDDQSPGHVTVTINGTGYLMTKVNTSDNDYTDGCLYQYTTLLAPGTYEYQFSCNDSIDTNTTSLYTGLVVSFANTPPALLTPSIFPGSGDVDTVFTFTVLYFDWDDHAPAFINVSINGTTFSMVKVYPSDVTYIDGCFYEYSTKLPQGTFNYSFQCSDGFATNSTGTISGFKVNKVADGDEKNPLVQFFQDNWLFILVGAVAMVATIAIAVSRKKKVSKTAIMKKLPETEFMQKTIPEYKSPAPMQIKEPEMVPEVFPQVPEVKVKFYCATCAEYHEIVNPQFSTWYSCPRCNQLLQYIKNCPACSQSLALTKEMYENFKGKQMQCTYCSNLIDI